MIRLMFTVAELDSNKNEYESGIVDYELHIETKNKKTGIYGCATICNNYKTIKVYEGNEDGSDDKEMSIIDFVNNYDYQLGEIDFNKEIKF